MERTCAVNDCVKPPRSGRAEYCAMHYHRLYRHGSVEATAHGGPSVSLGRRYVARYLPQHPLADKQGKVYEHRAVLYDKIGTGPHSCHWCGASLDWLPKGALGCINVDHLNDRGDDNRPENLVPSCHDCNAARGMRARREALLDAGWWSGHDTIARLRKGGRKLEMTEPGSAA